MEVGPRYGSKCVLFRCLILFFALGCSASLYAQDSIATDSVKTGVSLGRIKLANPKSIVAKYSYDPKLDVYVFTEKVGKYDINYPLFLSPKEYFDLVREQSMKEYQAHKK